MRLRLQVTNKLVGRSAVVASAMLAMALEGLLLVWWLDSALATAFEPALLWRNALPVFLLLLLIYGLSGRVFLSLLFGGGITYVLFKVNAIKELNLDEPLMPGDLALWHQVLHNMGFFAHYTGHRLWLLLLAMLVFAGVLWVVWQLEKRQQRLGWMSRIACGSLSLLVLMGLFNGDGPMRRAYSDVAMPGFALWDPAQSVRNVGLLAGLVRMSQEMRTALPIANEVLVRNFAKRHVTDIRARMMRSPPAELPDIVVVQSEAFFDPGVLKGIDFGEFTPNFKRLAATGITGSLNTPAYGGGTIRTEFETLTGYPILAFPSVTYPYYGLAKAWMPSIPHRLRAFGYSTALFHPFRGSFWNRRQIMPELGFQHTYYLSSFAGAERSGEYVSDHALFDYVLAHLDDVGKGPHYAMVITMENHGPWDSDPGVLANVLDKRSLPKGLSPEGAMEMTYYLSHLVNGDAALGEFAKRLLARPRRTVLVFYGDHLPSLSHAFTDLHFDNDGTATDQHTRYMLISNRATPPHSLNISSYELPSLLFDTIGLPEDGFLAFESIIRPHWKNPSASAYDNKSVQVEVNGAQLEVACRRILDATGYCSVDTH